jgi:cysteine desulfurase
MAIKGVMDQFPGAQVLVSSVEHDSVLAPAAMYNSSYIPVHPDGRINIEHFITQISDDTVLVSVQYANNEIGTVQPISEIAEIIDKIRKERRKQGKELPIYFHTDACQASNYLDLHVSRLGVDLMTINASKIYGPKQIGGLYIKAGLSLLPQTLGGGQERGQRSGTENVPAIIGFASALSIAQVMRQEEAERLRQLQKHFISSLQEKLPSIVINGTVKNRLANNIHVSIPGRDNEELVIQLDDRGIICAAGSACRASSEEPSHVLKAIGLGDSEAQSSLRFTMGRTTTLEEINITVDAITEIIG